MMQPKPTPPRVRPLNLLGILAFLGKYPGQVALSVSLLLVNIGYVASPMTDDEQAAQRCAMSTVREATGGLVQWVVGLDPYGRALEGPTTG